MQKLLIAFVVLLIFIGGSFYLVERVDNVSEEGGTGGGALPSDGVVSGAKNLDLKGKGLTKVPLSVFSVTSLESLDLSDNLLTGALQAEVRHLVNLRVLDLSGNQFTGVPAEIGQLQKLEVLDLSNNMLTGLPYELGKLSNLKILDLRGNDYAEADLEIIRATLSSSVDIKAD